MTVADCWKGKHKYRQSILGISSNDHGKLERNLCISNRLIEQWEVSWELAVIFIEYWRVSWASSSIIMKKWKVILGISSNTHEKLASYPGH